MARYDEDTQKFMEDVSKQSVKSIAKQVIKGRPLSEAIARQIVAAPVSVLEKQSGVKVLEIFKLLNNRYDHTWWDWEPETLWQTLYIDNDIEPSEQVKNIVHALQVCVKTDFAFEAWHVFENVAHSFSLNPVHFGIVQPLEINEAALAIEIIKTIRPKTEFTAEVCGYVAACAKHSGMVYLPEDLFPKECQMFLDDMGNNLELKERVKKLYPNVIQDDSPLGIQSRRLHEVREYVKENT